MNQLEEIKELLADEEKEFLKNFAFDSLKKVKGRAIIMFTIQDHGGVGYALGLNALKLRFEGLEFDKEYTKEELKINEGNRRKEMNKTLKLKQTKANKQKFWSPLLDLLKITTPVTRSELQDAVGFSDRAVRNEVSSISKFHPVIAYSSRKGYRLAQDFSKLNVEEAANEWMEVEHTLNELKARNKEINKRMKPLIAYQKKMEKVRPEVLFEIEKKRVERK